MLPCTIVVIWGLRLWYNKSNIRLIFCNKSFTAFFFEVQMSKEKPTPCLEEKNYSLDAAVCHLFYRQSFFSVQHLFSTSVNASHQFTSLVTVLKKKRYKWYRTKCFFNSFMTEAVIIQKPVRKSMGWFLYYNGLRCERIKCPSPINFIIQYW